MADERAYLVRVQTTTGYWYVAPAGGGLTTREMARRMRKPIAEAVASQFRAAAIDVDVIPAEDRP